MTTSVSTPKLWRFAYLYPLLTLLFAIAGQVLYASGWEWTDTESVAVSVALGWAFALVPALVLSPVLQTLASEGRALVSALILGFVALAIAQAHVAYIPLALAILIAGGFQTVTARRIAQS